MKDLRWGKLGQTRIEHRLRDNMMGNKVSFNKKKKKMGESLRRVRK